jgi:6,7-dimethyl-8-ribityllumazine synthase
MDKQIKKVFEGSLQAGGLRFAIVCSRFNELFTTRLLDGAVDALVRHGAAPDNIAVAWVPGSFEVPLAARKFAAAGRYDAVIALGIVIQGATAHANYINSQVASSLAAISQDTGVPVIYGVVTTENLEQAMERSGTKHGNRGAAAAQAAIEMANLLKAMDKDKKS